jgi:hypothetical protein
VDAFDRALGDCSRGRGTRRAADASIGTALSRGSAAVRRLDAIVINHLGDDLVTRTVWERERRVGYPARARRTGATPARPQVPLPLSFTLTHARRPELVDTPHASREDFAGSSRTFETTKREAFRVAESLGLPRRWQA